MGPVAAASAAADRRLRAKLHSRGIHGGITVWLDEHIENGVPELEELVGYLQDERVARVTARGVFNLRLWWMMHLVSMGALPWFNSLHALAWWPLAAVARRFHCGDCYRTLVVADII